MSANHMVLQTELGPHTANAIEKAVQQANEKGVNANITHNGTITIRYSESSKGAAKELKNRLLQLGLMRTVCTTKCHY